MFLIFFRILRESIPAKELERRGVCLLRLVITNRHVGLYGRTVLQFEGTKDLPSHSFTPGICGMLIFASENCNIITIVAVLFTVQRNCVPIGN